jgi:isopropylmalate/homocitrate/citramalate synthase
MTMSQEQQNLKNSFLKPLSGYHGEFTPNNLAFNANLQEFAQQVTYLCNLETNGKITPEETYRQIKQFCEQLERSKQELLENTNFNSSQ